LESSVIFPLKKEVEDILFSYFSGKRIEWLKYCCFVWWWWRWVLNYWRHWCGSHLRCPNL